MATIAVLMVDGVADWEIGVVLPAARGWFGDTVQIASIDGAAVTSIGGLRIEPQSALADLDPLAADLWILPGSDGWQSGEIPALSAALRTRSKAGKPIAAICGATLALVHAGLLDARAHTSIALDFILHHVPDYAGAAHYRDALAVSDGGIVTAAGDHPVSFAVECLRLLHPDREDTIAEMHAMFAKEFAAGGSAPAAA